MQASLHYSASPLDRADSMRRESDQIRTLWERPDSIVLPVYKLENLIDGSAGEAVMRPRQSTGEILDKVTAYTFLGKLDDTAVFSYICSDDQADHWQSLDINYCFTDLRKAGPGLPHSQASILAYARGISHWQSLTRYCAACGSIGRLENAGHVLCCVSPDCGKQWFPRTDPAVIMLIERVDESGKRFCLLGRSALWPKKVYSTLAGFVETGESLEHAVIREVYEEAGVVVDNVRYIASQPWPFPQSLMVGFIGTAVSSELNIDTNEVAEAHWFDAESLATFGNWGDETDGPKLPRPDSIARHLIDQWMAQ